MLKSPSQAENISTKLANLVDTEEDFVQSVNEVREIIDRVQKMKKDE
jgi:flagellar motility protein MotE (MotC chaperone)